MTQLTHYPHMSIANRPLVVERLTQDEAIALTPAILGLIVDSYSAQFEGQGKPLPKGAFASKYDTPEALERFQNTRIPRTYDRGGSYYAIHEPNTNNRLAATLKALPGTEIEDDFEGMACVGEILTHPARQHQGLGSALLLTYFTHASATNPEAGVVLDAYDNNPVNEWYKKLGLVDGGPSGAVELDGYELPTHYMVSGNGVTVSGIAQYLRHSQPRLSF